MINRLVRPFITRNRLPCQQQLLASCVSSTVVQIPDMEENPKPKQQLTRKTQVPLKGRNLSDEEELNLRGYKIVDITFDCDDEDEQKELKKLEELGLTRRYKTATKEDLHRKAEELKAKKLKAAESKK